MQAAVADAAPDEVTPPLTPGPEWSSDRVDWLRRFHRDRRTGVDGPAGEATWAVVLAGSIVGSVRPERVAPGVLETGAWLTLVARGMGVGTRALTAVVAQAAELGAIELRACTTRSNAPALAVLRSVGFTLATFDSRGSVDARLPFSIPAGDAGPYRQGVGP
ncbi:Acetyltransferase (GNAT) domain-containing protein [Modestobacter sp. DSM 44400]|nr:Acetyltransferase (GNAT) domain-containing protein [Modestobacter sp. DSM 44400]